LVEKTMEQRGPDWRFQCWLVVHTLPKENNAAKGLLVAIPMLACGVITKQNADNRRHQRVPPEENAQSVELRCQAICALVSFSASEDYLSIKTTRRIMFHALLNQILSMR